MIPRPIPGGLHTDPVAEVRRQNIAVVQRESAAMGVVNAAGVFLPVFLLRLGGTNLEVSLLTALPALGGFVLSIPAGMFLQTRRNVIPWYASARAVQYLVYAGMAVSVALLPRDLAIVTILVLWAAITLPGTLSAIASNVVLNVAGPGGRIDLLTRRYGLIGLTTAITVVLVGQVLDALTFPLGYQIVFVVLSAAGLVSCLFAIRIKVPDQVRPTNVSESTLRVRLRGAVDLFRHEPRFLAYESRRFLLSLGVSLTAPLIPLWYVREAHAPDAWIGVLGTCSSLGALGGYYAWRRIAGWRSTRLMLATATIGMALYPAGLAFSRDLVVIGVVTAFGAVMAAGLNLVLFDALMKAVPANRLVTFSGVDNSLANLAAILGPLAGATVADLAGIGPGLLLGAILTFAGALLLNGLGSARSA